MYLLLLFILGIVIGRNFETIYTKSSQDIRQVSQAVGKTKLAFTSTYMVEGIYLLLERKLTNKTVKFYTHDILCTCNRRSCKPLSINTYIRKIKAAS